MPHIAILALLVAAPVTLREAETPGSEIVAMDVEGGAVALRHRAHRGSFGEPDHGFVYEAIVVRPGARDVVEICRAPMFRRDVKGCSASAEVLARERALFATMTPTSDAFTLAIRRSIANDELPPVVGTHAGKRFVLAVHVPDDDAGAADATVSLAVDGDLRFAWKAPWQLIMAGGPSVWARVACTSSRCLVVAGSLSSDMRGGRSGWHVARSFALDDAPVALDVGACAGKPRVALVTNADDVSTSGERAASALRKAGCVVRGPDTARATRTASAVYARDVEDARARSLAEAFAADVAPLTWETTADVGVALGRP